MGITYADYLIDIGHYDVTPEQEAEMEKEEMQRELLPCHCTAEAEVHYDPEAFGFFAGKAPSAGYRIHCSRHNDEPGCWASTAWYASKEAAKTAWETLNEARPQP